MIETDEALMSMFGGVALSEISLKTSSQKITLDRGVTVIVGPNNCGKTTLLAELEAFLWARTSATRKMVDSASIDPGSDISAVLQAFDECASSEESELVRCYNSEPMLLTRAGLQVSRANLERIWSERTLPAHAAEVFALYLGVGSRLETVLVEAPEVLTPHPGSPLHQLWGSKRLESEVALLVKEAFGEEIFVNRFGKMISIHLGAEAPPETSVPEKSYRDMLKKMTALEDQGHGMRAFFNVALPVVAASVPIIIIDEPELFLHPPQARKLAAILANRGRLGGQVIVSTHSSDILQGFIMACEGTGLGVVRLTREGSSNRVREISEQVASPLYSDPLLRYSTVLEGLFYKAVVVCEAEGDSAYFSAVYQHSIRVGDPQGDIHFTYAHGNGRLSTAVRPLKESGVPVASIIDCDTLLDNGIMERLADAHGLDFEQVRLALEKVQTYVNDPTFSLRPSRSTARDAILPILDREDSELSPIEVETIKEAIKQPSGRQSLKSHGIRHLEKDREVGEVARVLFADLARNGIFVVPVGELESFHPEVSRKRKLRWIARVLGGEQLYKQVGQQHDFVARVQEYLREQALS
ncbi:ATP-dependent nuclease [Nakamurella sp.]|uniref:ATP-dependent nuclease n=1 Tax=Nakamurella sp. TaxID=1869182 RepID=UPI003B3B9984